MIRSSQETENVKLNKMAEESKIIGELHRTKNEAIMSAF